MNTNITSGSAGSSRVLLLLAFFSVYILWGSTYLAMHFTLESIPPFMISGTRFIIGGAILTGIARLYKASWPTWAEFKNASFIGFLFLVIGNGGVVWTQQYLPSGLTALIVSIEPMWVALILWLSASSPKPGVAVWAGIALGLIGMMILVNPFDLGASESVYFPGVVALLISSLSWAVGSVYSTRITLPKAPLMNTGVQMFVAGICMWIWSSCRQEYQDFYWDKVSSTSIWGFFYLLVCGSLLGFTSYTYIVRYASPTSASTHAYVNPLIAVILGWWIGAETMSANSWLASAFLITSVVLIVMKPDFGGRNKALT